MCGKAQSFSSCVTVKKLLWFVLLAAGEKEEKLNNSCSYFHFLVDNFGNAGSLGQSQLINSYEWTCTGNVNFFEFIFIAGMLKSYCYLILKRVTI